MRSQVPGSMSSPEMPSRARSARPLPPASEAALLARARALAGCRIGELCARLGAAAPDRLVRQKGRIGQVLEALLGTDAGARPQPDFVALGIELKTVPVDARGQPRESTFVCSASWRELQHETWPRSRVRKKLSCVLWVPIEAVPDVPVAARRVGAALLWRPDPEEERCLRADWEDLSDLFCRGFGGEVGARRGRALQLRPKARHAGVRQSVSPVSPDGPCEDAFEALPQGFYLRRSFTAQVLARGLALPGG